MNSLPELIQQLRSLGFSISTAETIEAHKMLSIATTPDELRLGIRMVLAKSLQEQHLFDLIWNNQYRYQQTQPEDPTLDDPEDIDTNDLPIQPPENPSDAEFCPNPPAVAGGGVAGSNDPSVALIRFQSDLKGSARQLIQGNTRNAAAILLRYILSKAYDLQELQQLQEEMIREVEQMVEYAVPDHAKQLMQRLSLQLNQQITEELDDPKTIGNNPLKVNDLKELPIMQLQPSPELQQALRRLGRKLATKHRRKVKQGSRRIDLRRTIRNNIQHGGTLLELKYKKPRLDRPKLTIITDVSSSTIHSTQLFLNIIWHAKEVFSDIHFFEFVSTMIDVTPELKRSNSPKQGIEKALEAWERERDGKENSDYHQAFKEFWRMRGKQLSQKDTIILLGDLRDWLGPWQDNIPMSAPVLGKIAEKVRRFIVLNPESEKSWNTGDSIVQYVEEYGIEVYEATTLSQLISALETL